jgi:hypothetical protein
LDDVDSLLSPNPCGSLRVIDLMTQIRNLLPPPPSDSEWVKDQLMDAVVGVLRVRAIRQRHPFGSTTATESLAEGSRNSISVVISLETDTIPARVEFQLPNYTFTILCHNPTIENGTLTYEVECT